MSRILRKCVDDARASLSLGFPSQRLNLVHNLLEVDTQETLEDEVNILLTRPQYLQCGLVSLVRIDQN